MHLMLRRSQTAARGVSFAVHRLRPLVGPEAEMTANGPSGVACISCFDARRPPLEAFHLLVIGFDGHRPPLQAFHLRLIGLDGHRPPLEAFHSRFIGFDGHRPPLQAFHSRFIRSDGHRPPLQVVPWLSNRSVRPVRSFCLPGRRQSRATRRAQYGPTQKSPDLSPGFSDEWGRIFPQRE